MTTTRHEKAVNAAVWLAQQGCFIGWGPTRDGKAVNRKWKSDMTNDPAMVPSLIHGQRNPIVVPAGRIVLADIDKYGWYEKLIAAGLPPTFTVFSPTQRPTPDGGTFRGRHVYGLAPEGYDVTSIPGVWAGGEMRRSEHGEQSMVLGPWAWRTDGIYEPDPKSPRKLAVLPESVLDFIKANPLGSTGEPNGGVLIKAGHDDAGEWVWRDEGGRHDYLRDRIRVWRGHGIVGEALRAMAWEFIERHQLNQPGWRAIDKEEVERMCAGAETKFSDDPPPSPAFPSPEQVEAKVKALQSELPSVINGAEAKQPADLDDWLVTDLLRPRSLAVLASTEGVGKSNMRLELGLRVACGHGALFDTYTVAKAGGVLLFDEENGEREEWQREETMLDALGLTRYPHMLLYNRVSYMGLNLDDPAYRVLFDDLLTAYSPVLVILDTAGSMVGEEHGKEFKGVIAFLKAMKEKHDCCILLVVHLVKPPRDGKAAGKALERTITDVMGQWTRAADVALLVSETDDDNVVLLRVRKRVPRSDITLKRDDPTSPDRWLRVDAKRMPPTVIAKEEHQNMLLAISEGRTTWEQVTGYLSAHDMPVPSRRTMFRHLAAMREAGLIVSDPAGVISLTDMGRALVPPRVSLDLTPQPVPVPPNPPTGGGGTSGTGNGTGLALDGTHEGNEVTL